MAAVFAQLIVGGESHGVHALVVPLRDERRRTCATGVRIEDCGEKMGLNGVDNGRIWFDQRPRPARGAAQPLRRRQRRRASTRARSRSRASASSRCSATLVQGRVCISGASVSAAKSALTIAVRYGLRRRQFGPARTSTRSPMLDYRTHQRRLMPLLAKTYALHFAQAELLEQLPRRVQRDEETARARAARARVAGRRDEGDRELARHRDDPDLPRVLRRRRLHERQPVRGAEGRHRRLHDLRGRQHGADDARWPRAC